MTLRAAAALAFCKPVLQWLGTIHNELAPVDIAPLIESKWLLTMALG
jgi:hypothetical protein